MDKEVVLAAVNQDKEANEQIITDKIFSFPSHKKIKINNVLIKDIKNNFLKSKNLYLDYTYYHYDDNLFTNIEKHPSIKECLKVHWPSQKYNGYKDKFKELLKQEINHIIVGPTFDFMWETYVDFEGDSIDFLENVMYRRQYQYRTVALQYLYHTLVQFKFWTFFKKISRTVPVRYGQCKL